MNIEAGASVSLDKLQRRLGGEGLRALRARLRKQLEGGDNDNGGLHLTRLTSDEYEAVALLLGLPARAKKSLHVPVADFDAALSRAGIAPSLREALETIDGPLVNQSALRAAADARWAALRAADRHPALMVWLATSSGVATLKRVCRQDSDAAQRSLGQADAVLRLLPARGLTRAQLAADALGSAHALDAGQPVATLVLAAMRHRAGQTADIDDPTVTHDGEPPDRPAERIRDIWAASGILVNELARPALFLNLPAIRKPPGIAGEPGYLSLRHLLRSRPAWAVKGRTVFVCENPNVVAIAADRWGDRCAPLVCTDGMPAAAQRVLLTQLVQDGAALRYHGDFDWPGIQIANHVVRAFGALPWRMGADDYSAAAAAIARKESDVGVSGMAAAWDDALAARMLQHGVAIDEEAVAESLLEDLRPPTAR